MIPHIHYEIEHLSAPMIYTETIRLLFEIKAQLGFNMERFEITDAFLHDEFGYDQTLYVKEMRRSTVCIDITKG